MSSAKARLLFKLDIPEVLLSLVFAERILEYGLDFRNHLKMKSLFLIGIILIYFPSCYFAITAYGQAVHS